MRIALLIGLVILAACSGRAWNTRVADHPQSRAAMLDSIQPGVTTEKSFVLRWGRPTQVMTEGAQKAYVYRNMSNPEGYYFPQYGNNQAYVIVLFQYGMAVAAYSSDTEGCRATFTPRPIGLSYDNPSTVYSVNCGVEYDGSTERRPIAAGLEWLTNQVRRGGQTAASGAGGGQPPMITSDDTYTGGGLK